MNTDKLDISELHNHQYIRLIEYAIQNNTFSINEACRATGISSTEFKFARDVLFILNAEQTRPYVHENQSMDWQLSPQAFFNYLQYREFKFAIESAENSKRNAWIAIAIAAITLIVSAIAIF